MTEVTKARPVVVALCRAPEDGGSSMRLWAVARLLTSEKGFFACIRCRRVFAKIRGMTCSISALLRRDELAAVQPYEYFLEKLRAVADAARDTGNNR